MNRLIRHIDISPTSIRLAVLLALGVSISGCIDGDATPTDNDDFFVNQSPLINNDELFNPDEILQVNIDIDSNDFNQLKEEGRELDVALGSCPSYDFRYNYFEADVTINDQLVKNVSVRKKGYLGSLTRHRPSFKVNFDRIEEGRKFQGLSRLTLNNNRQDPGSTRQCLAYQFYQQAGLKVPRCNFANVTVNGESMGVYTHVESINKEFLLRAFGNQTGNLYEAQVADFGIHLNQKFELKTNKRNNDRSDLEEIVTALSLDDNQLISELETLINLEGFISLWTADTILGNWDSATGNGNNFYIYHNPEDDLFHFIPWGTDAAFNSTHVFKPGSEPLFANFQLASRLLSIESTRNRYFAKLEQLLADEWIESQLLTKIDNLQTQSGASEQSLNSIREFIQGDTTNGILSQRVKIENALSDIRADFSTRPRQYLLQDQQLDCGSSYPTANLQAEFSSGAFGDTGTFSFTLSDGQPVTANMQIATLGPTGVDSLMYALDEGVSPSTVGLTLVGVDASDSFQPYVLQAFVESPDYTTETVSFHGIVTNVMLFAVGPGGAVDLTLLAVGKTGTISLSQTGDGTVELPIAGQIQAELSFIDEPVISEN